MKAFLLAAGEGRRLRPLTDTVPKCLVPICGTPLLAIWLAALERGGVTDVLINLHHAHEEVRRFLEGWQSGLRIETAYEPRLLGSAGTVLANRRFVADAPDFLVAYADNLTTIDLRRLASFHARTSTALTMAVQPTDRPSQKGTVVLDEHSRIVAYEEKSPAPASNLANAGIYMVRPAAFDCFPAAQPAEGILDFGYHVLPRLVPNLSAYLVEELLMDIGTPADYEKAQHVWPGAAGRTATWS